MRRARPYTLGRASAILAIGAVFLFPLYWTVTMAFKPRDEWDPLDRTIWFPDNPTLDNFRALFGGQAEALFAARPDAAAPILNSLIAATGGTALALAIGVPAAHAIARYRAGGRLLPFQALQIRMFPPIVLTIPILIMWVFLDLWDTPLGLILVYGALTFPFVIWLMRSFFREIPKEIAEAAIVDGCTHWGAFVKTILPQAKAGLAATTLFVFILNWSDFLIALTLTGNGFQTAPVYLNTLQGDEFQKDFGPQAALALLLIIPPTLLAILIQRHLIRGLTFGAIRR